MDINGISSSAYSMYEVSKTNSNNGSESTTKSTSEHKHKKPDANQITSMLTSKLGLNDNQVIAIKKLIQSSLSDDPMSALKGSKEDASAKKSMDAKMEQMDSDIESLLNDDQKAAYEKLIQDRKTNAPSGNAQGMPPQGGGTPPSATDITSMLTSKLGLNDNQQLEIKSLIQQSLKSSQNNDSSESRDSAMSKLNDSIKSLLNSDQTTAFEKMLKGE